MASGVRRSAIRAALGPWEGAALAPLLARVVVGVVTGGFFFGGFVGLVRSTDLSSTAKGVALGLLIALVALHIRNCLRPADGSRPRGGPGRSPRRPCSPTCR